MPFSKMTHSPWGSEQESSFPSLYPHCYIMGRKLVNIFCDIQQMYMYLEYGLKFALWNAACRWHLQSKAKVVKFTPLHLHSHAKNNVWQTNCFQLNVSFLFELFFTLFLTLHQHHTSHIMCLLVKLSVSLFINALR